MSDLIAELQTTCGWCNPCQACRTLMARAADAIQRLRAENAELRQRLNPTGYLDVEQYYEEEEKGTNAAN